MSNLDIESCRQLWESDEHWELRKEFIENYKDKFDVDRLLCLAQVYTNMELLGCSYPAPLMIQIRELAKELTGGTNLQQTRKARQIQFVKEGNNNSAKRGSSSIVNPSQVKRLKLSDSNIVSKTYAGNSEPSTSEQLNLSNPHNNPGTSQSSEIEVTKLNSSSQLNQSSTDNQFSEKLAKLKVLAEKIRKPILYGENSEFKCWAALHNTCQKLGYSHSSDIATNTTNQNQQYTITLKINDVIVGTLTDVSKKPLKGKVAKQAVDRLFNPTIKIVSDGENLILVEDKDDAATITEPSNAKSSVPVATPSSTLKDSASTTTDGESKVFQLDPMLIRNFIILDNTAIYSSVSPASVLSNSGQFCKMPINFEYSNNDAGLPNLYNVCEVLLGGNKISQASGPSRAQAKSLAACAALDSLSKVVYTVKIKDDNADGFIVPRSQLFECPDSSTILTESNIGCKMLKMMGWSGGGIGKDGNTGISEPIAASGINQQGQGLGYSAEKNVDGKESAKPIRAKIESLLLDYARSNTFKDLIFSSDFSPEERKHVHKLAHKYHLKSVSRGSGEDRHLTIGRRFTWEELLYNLKAAGGSTEKYELITPQQYIEETRKSASA